MLPGKTYTYVDYARMAWRRKWLLIVCTVTGFYIALIVSSWHIDLYQSEMLIQVVPQRVPDAYVRSTVTMRTEDRINTLAQQVLSRTELERLIEQMNLYPAERARLPMQDVVEIMRAHIGRLEIVRSQRDARDADAFYVRYSYPDAPLVTKVTERLGALFIDLNAKDRGNLAEATNEFLQNQLNEARTRLEEQEHRLEEFRQRNAGRLPTQLNTNMQAIQSTQLAVQAQVESLARDRDRKLMLERLYADAEAELSAQAQPPPALAPPATALVQAQPGAPAATATVVTPQQQLVAQRQLLAQLELRLQPQHPDIGRTKRAIQDLEQQVEKLEASAAAEAPGDPIASPALKVTVEQQARRSRLQEMGATIESLERQIQFKEELERQQRSTLAEYQHRIDEIPGVETEWVALMRDYDTMQAAYRELLTKSEHSKVAVDLEKRQIGEQFRVLDPARAPVRPAEFNRVQVNAMGAAIGLVIGIALGALLEYRDTSFRTGQDVLEVLKLPVVALVPYVMTAPDRQRTRRRLLFTSIAAAVFAVAGGYGIWALQLWKQIR